MCPCLIVCFRPHARDTEEGSIATENAIAAVAKILKYAGSQVDVTQVDYCLSMLICCRLFHSSFLGYPHMKIKKNLCIYMVTSAIW